MEADDPIAKSIRNTLLRYSLPVHLEVFCRGYKKHLGTDLPHKEFGFASAVDFLQTHYSHIVEVTPSEINKNVYFLTLLSDEPPAPKAQAPVNSGSSREEIPKPSSERIRYICKQIFGLQKGEALVDGSDAITANLVNAAGDHTVDEPVSTKQKQEPNIKLTESVTRTEITNGVCLFQVQYQGKMFIPLPCIAALAGLKNDSIREELEACKLRVLDVVTLSKDVSAHSKLRYELAFLNCPFVIKEDGSLMDEIFLVPTNCLETLIRIYSDRNSILEKKLEEIRAELAECLKTL